MSDLKIKVSLDEVNDPKIDEEIRRQDIAGRMAQHQETIRRTVSNSGVMPNAHGGFFRKSMVYMVVFGLLFSFFGWMIGEAPLHAADNHPFMGSDISGDGFSLSWQPHGNRRRRRSAAVQIRS